MTSTTELTSSPLAGRSRCVEQQPGNVVALKMVLRWRHHYKHCPWYYYYYYYCHYFTLHVT